MATARPLRRVRYLPDGRRFVLFENRALAIGAGLALGALIISLPHAEVDIPPEQYIVDADAASEDDIYGALQAGPVAALDRSYSLEEVLASIRPPRAHAQHQHRLDQLRVRIGGCPAGSG